MPQNNPSPLGTPHSEVNSRVITRPDFIQNTSNLSVWNAVTTINIPPDFTSIIFILYAININTNRLNSLRILVQQEFEPDHFTSMFSAIPRFGTGPHFNKVLLHGIGPTFVQSDPSPPITENITGLGINANILDSGNTQYYRNMPLMFPLITNVLTQSDQPDQSIPSDIAATLYWFYLR